MTVNRPTELGIFRRDRGSTTPTARETNVEQLFRLSCENGQPCTRTTIQTRLMEETLNRVKQRGGTLRSMRPKKRNRKSKTRSSAKSTKKMSRSTVKAKSRKSSKKPAQKRIVSRTRTSSRKRLSVSAETEIKRELQGRSLTSPRTSEDFGGSSRVEQADSESVDELVGEGNIFEAGAVAGVEEAESSDEREVHTHEVPEDDVPEEYLDKD